MLWFTVIHLRHQINEILINIIVFIKQSQEMGKEVLSREIFILINFCFFKNVRKNNWMIHEIELEGWQWNFVPEAKFLKNVTCSN